MSATSMSQVGHKILVLSGKGGVGKSTVASQLALAFVEQGYKVGLLDVDLCGPSIPQMLGLTQSAAYSGETGWIPVYADGNAQRLAVMSLGFLLEDKDSPVIWRGPKKVATVRQFIEQVAWGKLDYLIVDTPPGTSDEHISVCEILSQYSPDGAIIVTTPQYVSIDDVQREITFCKEIGLPILGIVENMSGFICPCCKEESKIFSVGGGQALAKQLDISFIGRIPIDPAVARACDEGKNFAKVCKESETLAPLLEFVRKQVNHANELVEPSGHTNQG